MKQFLILFFIIIILTFSSILIHNSCHDWGGDFALYIEQAKALWGGNIKQLLEQNRFGLENSSYTYYSPELYPWGWPILLSPMVKLVGLNYTWLKLVVMAFFIAMGLASFYLFRKKAGNTGSLLITACIVFNPALIEYTNVLRSAFPFLFFVVLALLVYEKQNDATKVGWGKIILAAFLFFYASIIRSEGFLLVAAVGVAAFIQWGIQHFSRQYLIDKKWLFQMAGVFAMFHIAYTLILPSGSSSHLEHFKLTTWETISGNISFYFNHLDYCFSSFLKQSFVMVMLPFVGLGLYSRFRKDMAIVIYFLLLHLLFIIWPHHEIRYLFIIIPFYFYFLFQGLQKINFPIKLAKKTVSGSYVIFSALLLVLLLDFGFYLIRKSKTNEIVKGPEAEDARQMFEFINRETQTDDVIVFFKPRVMSLYTGRRSCIIHDYSSHLLQVGNYVVLHKNMGHYNQLYSLIEQPPDWLTKKLENKCFVIYQIIPIFQNE